MACGAVVKRALDLTFDALTTPERLALLETCEVVRRQLPAIEHALINQLAGEEPAVLGGKLPAALADRLRISRTRPRGGCTRPRTWVSGGR